jgi:hypothetical protein
VVSVPPFDRRFYRSGGVFSRIGTGSVGGKAEGLVRIRSALESRVGGEVDGIEVGIPRAVVVATSAFDAFMARDALYEQALECRTDEELARAFQRADLPPEVLDDLRAVAEEVDRPLAIRSSSMLEDALERPFAGIYETKMIPNNQPGADARFQRLVEAIRYVYASTFFQGARTYRRAMGIDDGEEKMAVMIQEIQGERHGPRFYPHVSAVCRSYSYYPIGGSRREDGVVSLALGLGKTIVDGGLCWSYSPARPKAPPPFAGPVEAMAGTQSRFWAVNMGRPPSYDPSAETEYLVQADLDAAEHDGTLRHLASTYDPASDRLRPGTGSDGPRVLDFAPLLTLGEWPLNHLLRSLLETAEETLGTEVEIELAVVLPRSRADTARAGFVQVRPMLAPQQKVDLPAEALDGPGLLLASRRAMGNGVVDCIRDIVYVKPDPFDAGHTDAIAADIEALNRVLVAEDRPYLLIGFGRWGSSEPWLGVPVKWGQVAGARVIVEATLPAMDVEPSQGSHFFHNLSNTGVLYFTVRHHSDPGIDWDWLARKEPVAETPWVRHVRLAAPLEVRVDGRTGRGAVRVSGQS